MTPAASRRLVAMAVTATVALEVAAVGLAAGVAPLGQPVLYAVYATVQVAAGAVIVWHYPRHRIGWLLVTVALLNALFADAALSYAQRGAVQSWPAAAHIEVVSLTSWVVAALGLGLLFLLFPDGHHLSHRWRWVPALWLVGAVLAIPGWALNPRLGQDLSGGTNPLAANGFPAEPAFAAGTVLVCAFQVASLAALLVRFRRSIGEQRQQVKWVLLAAALLVVVLPVSAALWTAWPPVQYAPAVCLPLLPLAVCVAIVRQRLYDIDLVISRTVAWAALTGVLGTAYAATVVAVGAVVASPVAAAAGALVVAVAFRPVRTRVQDAVDRRFRRARYESIRSMRDFVDRLRRGEARVEDVEEAVRTALHDDELVVRYAPAGGAADARDRWSEPARGSGRRWTAVHTEHQVVTLVCHREADTRLVEEVLDAGRLALEIASLQDELHRRLEELDTSRARIVAIADEERRRLARDLHDGAQQRLVSIGLDLRHAQHMLDGTVPPAVDRTLDHAVSGLGHAIDDLRELASGLRPTSLDNGLGPALRELAARSPIPVEVQDADERFQQETEAAAYFIAAEGLTNAIKHASAHQVVLGVTRREDQLVLTVADDGAGGADVRRGSGLLGLVDRATAHGGSLDIDSSPHTGTRLTARLPCG